MREILSISCINVFFWVSLLLAWRNFILIIDINTLYFFMILIFIIILIMYYLGIIFV